MSDRVHSLTVVLDKNYREEDAARLADAIKCMRGVVAVDRNVADPTSHMAEQRALAQLRQRLYDALV
jgi:hypothetical protein